MAMGSSFASEISVTPLQIVFDSTQKVHDLKIRNKDKKEKKTLLALAPFLFQVALL